MSFNISHIIEGWRNELVPPKELKEAIEKMSEHRLAFCISCEHNSTPGMISRFASRCNECGCWLKAKSKSVDEYCPIGKWFAEGTAQEDNEIQKAISDEHSS